MDGLGTLNSIDLSNNTLLKLLRLEGTQLDTIDLSTNVNLEELGNSALYLVSDLSSAITCEIHYVDCGFNIVGMPKS